MVYISDFYLCQSTHKYHKDAELQRGKGNKKEKMLQAPIFAVS